MGDIIHKSDGTTVSEYRIGTVEFENTASIINQKFSWFDRNQCIYLTQPHTHEFINENIIRACVLREEAINLLGNDLFFTTHRIFDIDSSTSVLGVFSLYTDSIPAWVNKEMFIFGIIEYYEEYGRPSIPNMINLKEYAFIAPEETLVSLGLNLASDENFTTAYTALVNNNEIIAVRKYSSNDTVNPGMLSTLWGMVVTEAKKQKRMDIVRNLFSKTYFIR